MWFSSVLPDHSYLKTERITQGAGERDVLLFFFSHVLGRLWQMPG